MGLANRVVPRGQALAAAVALAEQLAKFPQETMRADRLNAYEQWDKPLAEALLGEWERSKSRIGDALQGAGRFASGEGRHGAFVIPAEAGIQGVEKGSPGFPPSRE
jgi:enoyl-CoA hydratase